MSIDNTLKIAQLIITPLSLILAYSAFKIQTKVLKSQHAARELDNKKFLLSIRPEFVLDIRPFREFPHEVFIVLKKNVAIDIKSYRLTDGGKVYSPYQHAYHAVDEKIRIYSGPWPTEDLKLQYGIEFSDEIGTRYYQETTGDVRGGNISPPMLLYASN